MANDYSPGLEGVIAGETAISSITEEGLFYRGYSIRDLAEQCSFEDVAYLVLHGELPDPEQGEQFRHELVENRPLHPELASLVRCIPPQIPAMDALRSAVSFQAHFDPEVDDGSHEANVRKAVRLLAQIPALIGEWHRARTGGNGEIDTWEGSHARYLLRQLTGEEPDADAEKVMDVSLILYAEHEYNASTFAARVTVSTLSDLHSGIVTGVGTLKGPLHGGANERAMEMLLEIGGSEQAEAWVRDRLARKERIMGFGHRVVRKGDTRATILHDCGAWLARRWNDTHWLDTADRIQAVVEQEKGLKPNVDFPCAWVYAMLGIPVDLYTPVFVAARTAGWAAHIIEQLDHNRLIRPRGLYVGPEPRQIAPLDERT